MIEIPLNVQIRCNDIITQSKSETTDKVYGNFKYERFHFYFYKL